MNLLATASPSDEIAQWFYQFSFICFIVAGGVALASVLAAVFRSTPASRRLANGLAVAAILLSLIPLVLVARVYQMDYVPVAIDGTNASRPLWRALIFPLLPILGAIFALGCCRVRAERS